MTYSEDLFIRRQPVGAGNAWLLTKSQYASLAGSVGGAGQSTLFPGIL